MSAATSIEADPQIPPTILVVDDDADNRALLRIYLEHEGFSVAEARDAFDCMDAVIARIPDLILMDVVLPEINGYQACRFIRDLMGAEFTPIVMVSRLAEEEVQLEGRRSGADGVVPKPIDRSRLLLQVNQLLHVKGMYDRLFGPKEG